jgi:hypothetical protein
MVIDFSLGADAVPANPVLATNDVAAALRKKTRLDGMDIP